MKIAIFTLGSRGDVQPYVALGVEALKYNHDVVICTGESFKSFIQDNNIEFAKADLDLMALLQTKEGQDIFNNGKKHILKSLKYAKEKVNPAYRKTMDQFYKCAKDADIIIYHPKSFAAQDISLKLNIPCICMSPVPFIYPIEEFPNLVVSLKGNLGKKINKLTYIPFKYADASNIKEINDFRENVLNLPKRKSGIYAYDINKKPIPIVYPVSKYLFEDVKTWDNKVYLPGFVFLENKEEKLDEKIEEFILKGSKPIVISFSSIPLKNPDKFKDILLKALDKTNNRAIILTGISGMSFKDEENILAVPYAPHNLLFPLSKGIMHHGGVGTMASALQSGKPQLIMPFSVDQPFWANRLYGLGYTSKPLNENTITVNSLAESFIELDNPKYISNSINIKKKLDSENGNENLIKYIESVYLNYKK
ncbi:glycosyltransferase [Paraclostridium bifermentans]|uniref:glycosyltransferase n=1 Tax=Paraclostridium bifermentans TaxID=1490 RepID=UPI001C7EA226|nr:glycosyltransferase [Paraclostridium bifermentans]GIM30769.1 glycosyl transferase family 1 [Paraclostridium bifermentans subsp. muricolitidis]